jgi:hypothetical protein
MEAYLSQDHFATLIPKMPDGENGWKVFKPNFVDFDPEHFKPVAAFLTSGDFHGPLRDEQGNELDEDAIKVAALELYLGAWEIADTLCLEDMMSRIVEKLRATHWPLIEMLSFTMAIYLAPTKLDSDVDKDMRKMLLSFICHHYRDYVEQLGTIFLDRLEELPELREQVYRRMSKEARKEFGEREKE